MAGSFLILQSRSILPPFLDPLSAATEPDIDQPRGGSREKMPLIWTAGEPLFNVRPDGFARVSSPPGEMCFPLPELLRVQQPDPHLSQYRLHHSSGLRLGRR